jgi:hypothetical protein
MMARSSLRKWRSFGGGVEEEDVGEEVEAMDLSELLSVRVLSLAKQKKMRSRYGA